MRVATVVVSLWGAAGCLPSPPEPVYAVQRSALVAHPAPPAWSGTPLRGRVQFRASNSTVLVPVEPEETAGANAGLFVARHNIGGAMRLRVAGDWELALSAEGSPVTDAMQISDSSLDPPDGTSWTKGAGLRYSAAVTESWRLGLGAELRHTTSPYREQGTCVANCTAASPDYMEEGTHGLFGYTMSLVPSYDFGDVVVFAGLTRQNHPTNTRKQRQTASANSNDDLDELREGPGYTIVGAGIEFRVWRHVTITGHVFQPLSTDVATYGPAVGFALGGELYDPDQPRYSRQELARALATDASATGNP